MKERILVSILDSKEVDKFIFELKKIQDSLKQIDENVYDLGIHFDIMDNEFVPNIGTKLEYIKFAKELDMYCDVHLMVSNPKNDNYITNSLKYGADRITIHIEIENFEENLGFLNDKNIEIGVAIKPNTNLEELVKYKDKFDTLLIMTVEPGFGGQAYIEKMNEKIIEAKRLFSNKKIEIDGGINFSNINYGVEYGVEDFVIGSYLSKSDNLFDSLTTLNIQKEILQKNKTTNIEFTKRILQIVENGYASTDTLLGVCVPDLRKVAKKWKKYLNLNILESFLHSPIHEFRQFALIALSNIKVNKEIFDFVNDNLIYINNWDLTDIVAPRIIGEYVTKLSDKEAKKIIQKYISSNNLWKKRIGIVTLLNYAKIGKIDFILEITNQVLYEEYHLYQKATGWVLREAYKKDSKKIFEYLKEKNHEKRVPRILLSYACEKMSKEQKNIIRSGEDK